MLLKSFPVPKSTKLQRVLNCSTLWYTYSVQLLYINKHVNQATHSFRTVFHVPSSALPL